MSDHTVRLGEQLCGEQFRDAVHVAVMPAIAAHDLEPGAHVGIVGVPSGASEQYRLVGCGADELIGIVDPYLRWTVQKGWKFWCCLYPGSITSLRHEWSHESIDTPQLPPITKAQSESWLRDFCEQFSCPDYETLLAAAIGKPIPESDPGYYDEAYSNDGEYFHFNGYSAHGDIPPEFWDHVQRVTGVKIPQRQRAKYFSCSC